jgi:hypothetical protein
MSIIATVSGHRQISTKSLASGKRPAHYAHAGYGNRGMIEAIRACSPIEMVVAEHLELRPLGRQFRSKCPFHSERTPSFYVSPIKGVFYCHGCHAGGDVFEFLKRFHHWDFSEAATYLGKRAGITSLDSRLPLRLARKIEALQASRISENAFENFYNKRTSELSDRYRQLGRSATWAENILATKLLTAEEREMAWEAIKIYRVFQLQTERENMFDIEKSRQEWQERGRTFGATRI